MRPDSLLDKIFPEWNVHSDFICRHLNAALLLDSKLSSHPIEVDVPDAEQIDQVHFVRHLRSDMEVLNVPVRSLIVYRIQRPVRF